MTASNCPAEIWYKILSYLEPRHIAGKCMFISKEFQRLSQDKCFWKRYLTTPGYSKIVLPLPERASGTRVDEHAPEPQFPDMQPFVSDHMALFNDLQTYNSIDENSYSIVKNVTQVSSEDNDHQTKDRVLDPSGRTFWSSKGSSDPHSSETITFSFHSTSALSKIVITPYRALYQAGCPIYAPLTVSFMVGFDGKTFHTVTEPMVIENKNEPQEFSISPLLIAGNYLRISLNGRRQRQPGDGLFYTVLQQVDILGFAVSSAVRDQSPTDKMIRAFAAPLFMNHHVNSGKPLRLVDIQKTWDHWKNLLGTANGFDEVEGEYFAVDVRSPLRSLEIFEMLIEAYLRILPNLVRVLDSWIVSGFQFTKQETLSLSRTLIDQGQEQFLISSLMGRDLDIYEEIGDMIRSTSPDVALSIYSFLHVIDKIVSVLLLELQRYRSAVQVMMDGGFSVEQTLELASQLERDAGLLAAKDFASAWVRLNPANLEIFRQHFNQPLLSQSDFLDWLDERDEENRA